MGYCKLECPDGETQCCICCETQGGCDNRCDMMDSFDADKVIKQLKDLKAMYWFSIANTGVEKLDFAYEKVGNALDKAIDIVKRGGVKDEVQKEADNR